MMRYLTISELIYINGKVLNNDLILSGRQQIRDIALLEAAAARPAASALGEDAYSTLSEKVAALFHSLARNHPFTDGNKRTATVAAIFMFQVNGQRVAWNEEEALTVILGVAEGQRDMNSMAVWFPLAPTPDSLEENAEKDMIAIAQIIEEHRWLLDELANR
jgi:death-on-curing protein